MTAGLNIYDRGQLSAGTEGLKSLQASNKAYRDQMAKMRGMDVQLGVAADTLAQKRQQSKDVLKAAGLKGTGLTANQAGSLALKYKNAINKMRQALEVGYITEGTSIVQLTDADRQKYKDDIEKFEKLANSLTAIFEERERWKDELNPEQYQLRISQKPTNIAEGFAYRKESIFPQGLLSKQLKRIDEKEYSYEHLELERDEGGIVAKRSNKLPISQFPVNKKQSDKSGVLVVWERPTKNPEFGTYYASIDPVSEGKTTTSDSLCSIFVYKNPVEVTRETVNGLETFIERDKIVASWCGRYDDINKTHEQLEKIIEWYNAWTVVENNISLFIQHMISRRKQKYLVPKQQILFLKDLGSNRTVYQEYGWKNSTRFLFLCLAYLSK
jgi:hypothetical protein